MADRVDEPQRLGPVADELRGVRGVLQLQAKPRALVFKYSYIPPHSPYKKSKS